jgi:hypothetical protein
MKAVRRSLRRGAAFSLLMAATILPHFELTPRPAALRFAHGLERGTESMTIKISIDCMGGDHGPSVTIPAAVSFLKRRARCRADPGWPGGRGIVPN